MRAETLAAITRTYPLLSGCGSLAATTLMRRLSPPENDLRWAPTPGGDILASLDDFVGRAVYFFGDLDPKLTWCIKRLLSPGSVALDIGANIGLLSLVMSKAVGPKGSVHSFEPNPLLWHRLDAAKHRNRAGNLTIHKYALGETETTLTLRVPEGNAGAATLIQNNNNTQNFSVQVRRLDDLTDFEKVELIKIDVEGFESSVLAGASRVLREHRPAVILECNSGDPAPINLLRDWDYQILGIPRCLFRMRTELSKSSRQSHDAIAVPTERFDEISKVLRLRSG